jgi:hypothetical protein
MNTKQLTLNKKAKFTPIIIERNYPDGAEHTCIFCGQPFIDDDPDWRRVWEHLDNNDSNNEVWNMDWAHDRCNQIKKFSAELQIIAHDKIKINKKWISASLGGGGEKLNKETQPNEQIDANREASQITELYLIERLLPCGDRPPIDKELDYNDTKDVITYRCYKKFGHGSQNTIDRALKMMTCSESPFCRKKRDGRLVIFQNNDK